MPVPLVVGIWAALAAVIVPLGIRLLIGIGFAAVTYVGIGALWDAAQASIWSNLGAAPTSVLTILAMAKVDDFIKIILSAGTAKLLFAGLNAATGGITRRRWSAPASE